MTSSTSTSLVPPWNDAPAVHSVSLPHDSRIVLSYSTFGQQSDPCLLLIQDFGCPGLYWSHPFCTTLAAAGFFVVRYDQRDTGESTTYTQTSVSSPSYWMPYHVLFGTDSPPPYTLQDLCRDAVGLLDGLHVKAAHMVGHSMGAIVVQQLLVDYPSRVLSASLLTPIPTDNQRFSCCSKYSKRWASVEDAKPFVASETAFFAGHCGGYPFPENDVEVMVSWSFDRHPPAPRTMCNHLAVLASLQDQNAGLSSLNECCRMEPLSTSTGQVQGRVMRSLELVYRLLSYRNQRQPLGIEAASVTVPVAAAREEEEDMPFPSSSRAPSSDLVKQTTEVPSGLQHIPVIVVHGGRDTIVPIDWSSYLASLIPTATLIVYPKMGHFLAPAALANVALDVIRNAKAVSRPHFYEE